MATRQYIGARYVPKFYQNSVDGSANWQSNVVYEPLTYVTLTNGHMYISKKQVPATVGTPANNAEYWLDVGSYNGFIDELQDEIDNLDSEITALTDKTINVLPYEFCVFIGDSYTTGASLESDVNKRYSTLLSNMLGLTEKNYAVGNCGFLNGQTPYTTQITNAINDFETNNLDPDRVKYVIIGGTRNDGFINNTIASSYINAVRSVINTALTTFKNAQIVIAAWMFDASFMPWNYQQSIKRLKQAIGVYAPNKVIYIDDAYTWLSGMFEKILYQDGANVHPNVEGHSVIASHMYSALMGNNYKSQSAITCQIDGFQSGIDTSVSNFSIDKNGDIIHIHIQYKFSDITQLVSGNIYYKQLPLSYVEEYFFGNQQIYFLPIGRVDYTNGCRAYVACTAVKTGDNSGTLTLQIRDYSGNYQNGQIYYADIYVKNGIINSEASIT